MSGNCDDVVKVVSDFVQDNNGSNSCREVAVTWLTVVALIGVIFLVIAIHYQWRMYKALELRRLRKMTEFLSAEEIVELQIDNSQITEIWIRKLYMKYLDLDDDRSGTITVSEFLKMPTFKCNPLGHRIFAAFDANQDGHLDFQEFVTCFQTMSQNGSVRDKARTFFRICDVDGDGKVSRDDLFNVVSLITHRPRTKQELTKGLNYGETMEELETFESDWDNFISFIVDQMMTESSSDDNLQYLSFQDFMQSLIITKAGFVERMNLSITI